MNRRTALKSLACLSAGFSISPNVRTNAQSWREKKKTILVVTGRQYCNIGDQGHATGILQLLNTHLPEARIIVWPRHENREFEEMLLKYWPDTTIVNARLRNEDGELDDGGEPDNEEIHRLAEQADMSISGSGGGIMGGARWLLKNSEKPHGAYGITYSSTPGTVFRNWMDTASFLYTRDTKSLDNLKALDLACEDIRFGPDATFATAIEDDEKAWKFMRQHGLTYKKFLCVVPRLRVTPYYRIPSNLRGTPTPWTEERIREVDELNDKHKEADHAKAREAMIAWVRRTGYPVLVCPEMYHNMEISDELLIDPLPEDIKKHVIKRETFWMVDEATTVYKNASAVISFECHSPIIACNVGTPTFYLRQPEDTVKGQMWYDIGLDDWVFEIEETSGEQITDQLMEVHNNAAKARRQLEASMDYVRQIQRDTMAKVREVAGL